MRGSSYLSRGAKGYAWYTKYTEQGLDGFRRSVLPSPFDWSKGPVRPRVYLDLLLDTEPLGRLEFELAEDVVPKTVDNFRRLLLGQGMRYGGYKGTRVHQVQKGHFIVAGDVTNQEGKGNHSAFAGRFFPDENFIIPHSTRGLLSMASVGVHTNGSQFYIGLSHNPHLNGRCVVFGRLSKGLEVLDVIEKLFCFRGSPARALTIADCGLTS